jgi:hypothetical protein
VTPPPNTSNFLKTRNLIPAINGYIGLSNNILRRKSNLEAKATSGVES